MSEPIRLGIIGLSAQGSWAAGAHLPYLESTSRFIITALCNSSIEAAEATKKKYKLPDSTKLYASPADLAVDDDVDLVVCSVRVDKHYETLVPIVEKGKACYVEWPLGANLQEAEDLLRLAKKSGSRMMAVGLQGRRSPVANKVKTLLGDGRIGRVLSSTVVGSSGNYGATHPASIRYLTEKKFGGNMVTIHFMHLMDTVLYALGELTSFNAVLSNQRPKIDLTDGEGKVVERAHKDTEDQIMIHGQLQAGGVLSVHQRGGAPFKGVPGLLWSTYGEKGEIRVTADGSFLQIGYPNMSIQVHDHKTDEVEVVEWKDEDDAFEKLPQPAQNVARLYEAWADGRTDGYADWEEAVKRHRFVDELYKASEEKRQGKYV